LIAIRSSLPLDLCSHSSASCPKNTETRIMERYWISVICLAFAQEIWRWCVQIASYLSTYGAFNWLYSNRKSI
jgi:hypothetical protein